VCGAALRPAALREALRRSQVVADDDEDALVGGDVFLRASLGALNVEPA
jgi:hypothetical protein